MKNSTTNRTHLYSVTVSNMSKDRFVNLITLHLPTKYLAAFARADQVAQCQDAPICCESQSGSGEAYFVMDANLANALRKWFKRRFKGRSKFARQIVPTQFCACVKEVTA